jgi:FHA domain-containing protein
VRYRLRFVLQELDLPQGGTIIGRSLDCHLTLEDPLVSRRHARIVVDEAGARIEDMGSRNGVRVNGAVIHDPVSLRNGDRVRIGTQDFVFCCVDVGGRAHSRTTGQLRLCASCRLPYPRELLACPNCEATEQTDDDTLTGNGRAAHAWNVQLMVESLERALKLSRVEDAERLVQRAIAQIEEVILARGLLDGGALAGLCGQAAATSLASGDPTWAQWVLDVYGRTLRVPPLDVIARLAEVGAKHAAVLQTGLDQLLARLDSGLSPLEADADETAQSAAVAAVDGVEALASSGRTGLGPLSAEDSEALGRLRELRAHLGKGDAGSPSGGPGAVSKSVRHFPTA